MVERSRRGKGKQKLLGNHQRCWLWGRNLVRETLAADRWPIVELLVAEDLPGELLESVRSEALARQVKLTVETRAVLDRLGHTSEHQGFLAKMTPFPYESVESVLERAPARPLYLVLDEIQDPFNFGAMLRSAGAFGVDAVFVGSRRQSPVTSLVARSSAGVINRVPLAQAADLGELARNLRNRGVMLVGATAQGEQPLPECPLHSAVAIVIGNEGTGISAELLACCDRKVRIPLAGAVESLNAAAAAGVFLYEVQRQRGAAAHT